MEQTSEGEEICPMGAGSVLQKLGTVRLQSTDATTGAVDPAMPRKGQVPHGLEVGFKRVILLTGETAHPFPTVELEVLRDLQRAGEAGTKRSFRVQVEDRRVNKKASKALPGFLPWVATDPSALLREALVDLLLLPPWVAEVLLEVLLEPLPWGATDPFLLLR